MYNVSVVQNRKHCAIIEPSPLNRDWMDSNMAMFPYNCTPMATMNKLGWTISFPEDISFIWNGSDSTDSFDILSGNKYCYTDRGLGILSLITHLTFKTEEGLSTIFLPPLNSFIDGIHFLSSVLSTSFFDLTTQVVMKITKPNEIITIPKGFPVATAIVLPISQFQESTAYLYGPDSKKNLSLLDSVYRNPEYSTTEKEKGEELGRPAGFYKNAIDHKGNKIGSHELTNFKFYVKDGNE